MKKVKKLAVRVLPVLFMLVFILPSLVLAATQVDVSGSINSNLDNTGLSSLGGASAETLPQLIGKVVEVILGFLGIVFVLLIIWAGFQWMTAGGDTGKVDKAKKLIINAIIGVVIIMTSYGITKFVIDNIVIATAG